MKTLTMKNIVRGMSLMAIVMMAGLTCNLMYAQSPTMALATVADQQLTIKGKVSDDKGALPGVNIVLKGSKVGVVTDENGAFTFPRALSAGDVLVFSFLGYEKQEVKIDADTTFINLILTSDLVEIMGAPNTDKPYKSKRSN
ncbi:carboxypeptidase-like regulatory domain-containing protein [Psychroserpens sp. SPM9]|uniref:carboxypeptidase-like regulatory domain-containing protein n=1 Tax=Psychroserpens sp. SPM9 TaxID=2975598 RepID=UPI0021A6C1D2|nr:carboxypeptidase-like regulatory domain-containing protein [Psychroserpens sp. SPM9]MDG5490276.1 carboxypeptidase-like regulatory domain-containing protein [Psychroserpens sp. SPM9]